MRLLELLENEYRFLVLRLSFVESQEIFRMFLSSG